MVFLQGNCLDILKTINDESIDCIITSPPYYGLRDYKTEPIIWDEYSQCEHNWNTTNSTMHSGRGIPGSKYSTMEPVSDIPISHSFCTRCNAWKGQLGQEPTIQLFVKHLVEIFRECKRVLKKEGTCWVVISDSFDDDKSMSMVPERFAMSMIDDGWILRNKIIWKKNNCMPSSAKDRFTVDYENIYFFTKSRKYYFKTQYEPFETQEKRPMGITRANNWGYISKYDGTGLYGKKNVKMPPIGGVKQLDNGNPTYSGNRPDWSELGRNARAVWEINTKPFSEAHFAVFPEKLVEKCLDAGCPDKGTVLDIFSGAGTTALVAQKSFRNWIGIELNKDYIEISKKRLLPFVKQMRLDLCLNLNY